MRTVIARDNINQGFYDYYGGNEEEVDALDVFKRGCIVMSLEEAVKFSGVPKKEWLRLINEHKIHAEVNPEYGRVTLWYNTVKQVKYWWQQYQKDKILGSE